MSLHVITLCSPVSITTCACLPLLLTKVLLLHRIANRDRPGTVRLITSAGLAVPALAYVWSQRPKTSSHGGHGGHGDHGNGHAKHEEPPKEAADAALKEEAASDDSTKAEGSSGSETPAANELGDSQENVSALNPPSLFFSATPWVPYKSNSAYSKLRS